MDYSVIFIRKNQYSFKDLTCLLLRMLNYATRRIELDFKDVSDNPIEGVAFQMDNNNIFNWTVFLEGPKDSIFEGGIFQLSMKFPQNYPESPPTCKFINDFWHPNVYSDGKICMSLLHPPGHNEMDNESFDIRWKPVNGASTIVNSIFLILQEPNFSSPANIDASIQWRKDFEGYKRRIKNICDQSRLEFQQCYSDIFIPHPESNPNEKRMHNRATYDPDEAFFDDEYVYDDCEFASSTDSSTSSFSTVSGSMSESSSED